MSPLLANILLHQLDGELYRRGHRFARYADDLVILVKSQRAGERAIDVNPRSIKRYLDTTLKLKVNPAKSKVASMSECSFLGFTIKRKKVRWTDKTFANFRHRVKELTGRSWGLSMDYRLQKLGNILRAGRGISASASTTTGCQDWTTGSGDACACATGNSGAGRAPRSVTWWPWA